MPVAARPIIGIRPRTPGLLPIPVGTSAGSTNLSPSGIASGAAFGTATLSPGVVVLSPSGIGSAEVFGTAALSPGAVSLVPGGIGSAETFGTTTLSPGSVAVSPSGIASTAAFGTAALSPGAVGLSPSGIAPSETFGTATLVQPGSVAPPGIASGEAFGTAALTPGTMALSPSGIGSDVAFGIATLTPGSTSVTLSGIATAGVFGTPSLSGGLATPIRDYHLLADAVTRLAATGIFDAVYLAGPQEYAGRADFATLAFVYQVGWTEDDQGTTGDLADCYRTVEYRVAVIARDVDPTRRYMVLDRATAAAQNALSGVRLADASMPAMTRLRMGRYVAFPPPLGGVELRGEAQRILAGYAGHDDRDDVDELDP